MKAEKTESMRVPMKVWGLGEGVPFEDQALEQMRRVCGLPFIHKHAALMPDAHLGIGATIGSVIPTAKAIIPAAVGVDLGCGMIAVRTGLSASDLPDNLGGVRSAIEASVPHGRTDHGGVSDKGSWTNGALVWVLDAWGHLADAYARIGDRHEKALHRRSLEQLGTLGTGNHFIEVCLDEMDTLWVMLHSGSRGPGNRIASHFIALAKKEMKRWQIDLPDADLAYLPEGSEHFGAYVEAVAWAQRYALVNREIMMQRALAALLVEVGIPMAVDSGTAVNCHHNYVQKENHFGENVWVTRKGAVSAREGELGIIPGSMGTKSFIVRGKGNRESFHSCSHGAGRVMSRTAARKRFTVEDHEKATAGVECRKDQDVLDETPAAYKNIESVMAAQSDLVDVVHTLKQVVCVKG